MSGMHISLLAVILNKCEYFEKLYIYPTQETLLKWLKTSTGIKRCRRSLNYYLRRLEDRGQIRRKQRHHNDRIKGHVFCSSIYEITFKGLKTLNLIGIQALKVAKQIKELIRSEKSKVKDQPGKKKNQDNLTRLEGIVAGFTRSFEPP